MFKVLPVWLKVAEPELICAPVGSSVLEMAACIDSGNIAIPNNKSAETR